MADQRLGDRPFRQPCRPGNPAWRYPRERRSDSPAAPCRLVSFPVCAAALISGAVGSGAVGPGAASPASSAFRARTLLSSGHGSGRVDMLRLIRSWQPHS